MHHTVATTLKHTIGSDADANTRIISSTIGIPIMPTAIRGTVSTTIDTCCVPFKYYLMAAKIKSRDRTARAKDTCLAGLEKALYPFYLDGCVKSYRESRKPAKDTHTHGPSRRWCLTHPSTCHPMTNGTSTSTRTPRLTRSCLRHLAVMELLLGSTWQSRVLLRLLLPTRS